MNDITESLRVLNKWHLDNVVFGDPYRSLITLKLILLTNKYALNGITFTECVDMKVVTRAGHEPQFLTCKKT